MGFWMVAGGCLGVRRKRKGEGGKEKIKESRKDKGKGG